MPPMRNLLACTILLAQAFIALDLLPRHAATRNECAHIPAGLACWYADRFEVYHVNPPLPRMLATVPLLWADDICVEAVTRVSDEKHFRQEFQLAAFFADTNALNYHSIVCQARLAGVVWLIIGGWLLWRWATELFGGGAALMALILWASNPMLNSHAVLATPDVPATVAGLLVGYMFWRFTRSGSMEAAFVCGAALGVALLTKFTHLLWLPVGAILFALAALSAGPLLRLATGAKAARLMAILMIAWFTVWLGYWLDGSGTRLESLQFVSTAFGGKAKGVQPFRDTWLGSLPSPVPPTLLAGLDAQQRDFEGRERSFLRGEWRSSGWWYFYLYGLGVKTPTGLLLLIGISLVTWLFIPPTLPLVERWCVWLPPLTLLLVASLKFGFTHHVRYVLPAFPFFILGASRLAEGVHGVPKRLLALVAWGLVSWSVISVAWQYPNWLGYFNEFGGGPLNGWQHLADSNVDWGQDLIDLRHWLEEHPEARPFRLAYHNFYDYRVYLREQFSQPTPTMRGFVAVDAYSLTQEHQWLTNHEPICRIGTSIFIYRIP